jgi:hypothetical protein
MPISPDKGEGEPQAIIHFATTLENYKKCAVVEKAGVFFDKSRESKHVEPFTIQYVGRAPGWAMSLSMSRARELHHSPAVLQGELPEILNSKYMGEMPEGSKFPVIGVWIPKVGTDWQKANPFDKNLIGQQWELVDPKSLLGK